MPRLLLNFGTPQECEFQLKPGPNFLGRAAKNDFRIEHHSISSSHCQIMVEDGSVTIQDLGSTNGTFVDLIPIRDAPLQSGQTLRLGEVELLFDADTPAELTITQSTGSIQSEPPIPPPIPLETVTGPPKCNTHTKYAAKFQCSQCRGFFCDLCVATQRTGGIQRKHCRVCGAECLPVNPLLLKPKDEDEDKTFFALLPKAFKYPFQGDGWILMVTGTIFYLFVDFIAHAKAFGGLFVLAAVLVTTIFAFGYLFSYMTRIILTTADGAKQMPDWPDFLSWGDVMVPMFQLVVILAACFSPMLIISLISIENPWMMNFILPALVLGCLYLPMGMLAVALADTVLALNPLVLVPSMLLVYREYIVACGVLFVILLVQGAINFTLSKLNLFIIPGLIGGAFGWYFLTVEMRILGLLYRTKKQELGWFKC
ncbi:MAG: domain containing protein [Pedosphaera sp.]|nr:domain containing protein [Pedosphaera sp.]